MDGLTSRTGPPPRSSSNFRRISSARVKGGDIRLKSAINRFEVRVSDTGDVWIERLRW